jgi:hypothetical protein
MRRGSIFLQACNRRDIKAEAVLFPCLPKGGYFRFPTDQEFLNPNGSPAVLHTSRLGASQNVVYGRRVPLGVTTPERFHSGVDFAFLSRPNGPGVDFYSRRACGAPCGTGVHRSQYRSLYIKLFRGNIYQYGGWFVWDIPLNHFEDGSLAMGNGVVPAIWSGDLFLESSPVGSAQGGQRRSKI